MKIYCVRHGQAESADTHPDRPLTELGRQEVEQLAAHLQQRGIEVAHVMHSSQQRAGQTAEIFAKALSSQRTECPSILEEDASVDDLMAQIPAWTDDTMLVGHLPFMPQLVSGLVISDSRHYPIVNFPPATVVCLECYHQEQWVIDWILHPNLVAA
jgi:phosphohistidine phosphatase